MTFAPLPAGAVLRDRYRILETLGESRVATTYLAEVVDSGERCVVKELSVGRVIRTSTGAESFSGDFTKLIELFEREARVLANLSHAGVPRLLEHFTEEGDGSARLYMVQEFVAGRNLAELVEGGRHFSESEVVSIGRAVAEILAHLHALSPPLVHRDIKPSNVMLADDGTVHLIDFGAVKTTLEVDDLGGQTVVGTYGYMPLEQYEARALPASDVYALGATLLYLLSHKAPHELPRRGVRLDFQRHVNVSDGVAGVLERMVEPAAEDRYADGGEVRRALEDAARPASRPLARPTAPRDLVRVAVAAGVVAITGVVWLMMRLPVPAAAPPGAATGTETGAGRMAPVRPVDGVLAVDLYRDFRYVSRGWPMGRSVAQTGIGALRDRPREELSGPAFTGGPDRVLHGALPLGNGPDPLLAFVLARVDGTWELWVDGNNDEDMDNDGPPHFNEGSGTVMAAAVTVTVEVATDAGESFTHPYDLWVWFNPDDGSDAILGRFYGRNHWAGELEVDGVAYPATAFEMDHHDALYREAGLCVDLDLDGECQEARELFRDGEVVRFPLSSVRLSLRYP